MKKRVWSRIKAYFLNPLPAWLGVIGFGGFGVYAATQHHWGGMVIPVIGVSYSAGKLYLQAKLRAGWRPPWVRAKTTSSSASSTPPPPA